MASFAVDLNKWIAKANENTEKLVREVVIGVGERIVERTPVGDPEQWGSLIRADGSRRPPPPGYVGGRARANWQYGFGAAPDDDLPDIDATGQASLNRIEAGVGSAQAAGIHYIANNLPYAQALEDGHSTQAPNGMVGLAAVEFQSIVDEEAAKLK